MFMNNLNLRKKIILLILPFIALLSNAQVAKDLLGQWEGIHHIGTPPEKNRVYGGIGGPSIYDSCKVILTITEIKDSVFKGNIYEYIIYDEQGTYFKAEVNGIIRDKEIYTNPAKIIESKFTKYHLSWCTEKAISILKKKGKDLFLESINIKSSNCITGPSVLHKILSKDDILDDEMIGKTLTVPEIKIPQLASEDKIITSYKKRSTSVVKTIEVESDSLTLGFYDNGTIDGDSISVFLNNELKVKHKRLTDTVFTMAFKLDKTKAINEIGMFAENLGTIPPNTAVMIIKDMHKSYSVFLSSNMAVNAVVKIKRKL